MGSSSNLQSNFSGGEWSKTAQGRYDLPEYEKGMAVCQNGIPTEEGAWTRRPGTQYAGITKAGRPAKLLEFDFEADAPYRMEFTDNALRFRIGSDFVYDKTATVSSISAGAPPIVTTSADHGFSTGDEVIITGLGTNCSMLHGRQCKITVLTSTTFSLQDPVTGAGYDSFGLDWVAPATLPTVKRIMQLTTTYGSQSWQSLQSVQTDLKAILLNGTAPQVLTVTSEPTDSAPAVFSLSPAFFTDGPYLDPVSGGTLATPSSKTGVVTITLAFDPYVSTKAYAAGTLVTYSSANYVSLQDANVNHQPDISPTYWTATTATQALNDGQGLLTTDIGRSVRLFSEPALWAVGTAYAIGNIVKYNDTYWTALTANTGKIPGNDLTNWTLTPGNAAVWTWGKITALLNMIDRALAGSVNIGDMTANGGLAAAFDDVTVQASAACASKASTTAETVLTYSSYVGKNYSGATAQQIAYATLWPSTDIGLFEVDLYAAGHFASVWPGSSWVTVNLRAKSTAPASPSDGTLLGTSGLMPYPATSPAVVQSTDASTAWNYVWFEMIVTIDTSVPIGSGLYTAYYRTFAAEAQYFKPPTASSNGFQVAILGDDLLYTTPVRKWRLGTYSETTGYPTCGTWHEGRLWLSGVVGNRVDASKSNDPFNFAPTGPTGAVADNNAISYTFTSPEISPIYWLQPDRQGIVAGTKRGEWIIQATSQNAPLTPTTMQAHRDTSIGCANIPPAKCEHSTIYVQSQRRKVREHFSDAYSGKFTAPNLSAMAKHLTKDGINQVVYQQESTPIVWMRTGAGALVGASYKRDTMTTAAPATINGWHRHVLGSARTVESLSVGPSQEGNVDSLAMVTSDGTTRHVEVMTQVVDENAALGQDWLLDDAVRPTASIATVRDGVSGHRFYGLWHLIGSTVSVFIGGIDCGDVLVASDGTCFVPYSLNVTEAFMATKPNVVIGFTYSSRGQLLRPHSPQDTGAAVTGFAKSRRSQAFGLQMVRSCAPTIGTDFSQMLPVLLYRDRLDSTALDLYSGVHYDQLQDQYSYDSQLAWEMTRPLPLTVAAIGAFLHTQDR
jgi:hypothetical protein